MLVADPSTFAFALSRIANRRELTVDCETTGLRIWNGDRLCGVSVDNGEDAFYFAYRHKEGPNLPAEHLGPLLRTLERTDRLVMFNGAFDLKVLYVDGMKIPEESGRLQDVLPAAHLMNENESHKLKVLSDKYLGDGSSLPEEELEGKLKARGLWSAKTQGKDKMWMLPASDVSEYACQDVVLTRKLRDFYEPHLRIWRLYDIWEGVNDYLLAIIRMERLGMRLDVDKILELKAKSVPTAEAAKAKLAVMAGYAINPRSNPQLQSFMQLPSTSRDVLDAVIAREDPRKEAAETLLQFRGWDKASTTYYDPYMEWMDASHDLRTTLSITGTVPGRLSSQNPNLQAVPRFNEVYPVKDCFVSRDGKVLISADYSQAEMRLGSHHADERHMAAYLIAGNDIHQEVANANNIPRDYAKRINFGIIYGLGPPGLASKLHISIAEATRILNAYHKSYPGFRALYRRMQAMAERQGYIRYWTGRVRHYGPAQETRKAMSNLIQGGVAEVMRTTITRLHQELVPEGLDMLLQVHDDIIYEVPEDRLDFFLPEIEHIMTDFNFSVPMTTEIKYGKRWGKMQKWDHQRVAA